MQTIIAEREYSNIAGILGNKPGCYMFVGAGGKSSLMRAAARDLSVKGRSVIVTTSTHIRIPRFGVSIDPVNPETVSKALKTHRLITVGRTCTNGKFARPRISLESLRNAADVMLVEADGSKEHPLKIPNYTEPVYPFAPDGIVCVIGISALGRVFENACFRCELLGKISEKSGTDRIQPEDIARLIVHEKGILWNAPKKVPVTVVINQCDTPDLKLRGCEIAHLLEKDNRVRETVIVSVKNDFGGRYADCCERCR